jgi:hypothetical protein
MSRRLDAMLTGHAAISAEHAVVGSVTALGSEERRA